MASTPRRSLRLQNKDAKGQIVQRPEQTKVVPSKYFRRKGSFPFLKLPTEVRNLIYRRLFREPGSGIHIKYAYCSTALGSRWLDSNEPYSQSTLPTHILRACRQIHEEAAPVLYFTNKLCFHGHVENKGEAIERFATQIGSNKNAIRNISVSCRDHGNCSIQHHTHYDFVNLERFEILGDYRARNWIHSSVVDKEAEEKHYTTVLKHCVDVINKRVNRNSGNENDTFDIFITLHSGTRMPTHSKSLQTPQTQHFFRELERVVVAVLKGNLPDFREECGLACSHTQSMGYVTSTFEMHFRMQDRPCSACRQGIVHELPPSTSPGRYKKRLKLEASDFSY